MVKLHLLHSLSVFIFLLGFLQLQVLILFVKSRELLALGPLHSCNLRVLQVPFSPDSTFEGVLFFLQVKLELFLLLTPFVHHILFDQYDWRQFLVDYRVEVLVESTLPDNLSNVHITIVILTYFHVWSHSWQFQFFFDLWRGLLFFQLVNFHRASRMAVYSAKCLLLLTNNSLSFFNLVH